MAVAWLEKGGIYLEQQNIDKAILAYKRAIELDENLSLAWQDLGNAYSKKEMYDAAIKAYENAVRIDPDRMLEIAAKRDLCIKSSQEFHERAKHLQEKDELLRETERLQYQNEMLQKEKDEQRNEKNNLQKEKDDLIKKTEKLQYELKMLVTKKKWQITSIVMIFGVFMAGFLYYSILDSQVKFEEYENNLIPFQETVDEYRTSAFEYNDIFARYLSSQSELLERKSEIKDEDRSMSILLALESLRQCWTPEGYRALLNSIKPFGDLSRYGVPELIYNGDEIDQMASSQDGTLLAIWSGASIQLWNLNTWKPVGKRMRIGDYRGLKKIIFSNDGRLLAAINDYDVKIWITNSQVELVNTTFYQVSDISFNNNGTQVAIANQNHVQLLMLAENSTSLNRLTSARNESDINGFNNEWIMKSDRRSNVKRVSFSENGGALAIISNDGAMLNLTDGNESNFNDTAKNYIITSSGFNQNKTRLAISIDDIVDIWDMMNCTRIRRIYISGVRDMALSPDGNSLAVAIPNDIIRVYGIGSKNITFKWDYKLEGATDYPELFQFSPDGKRLFVSDYSNFYYPLRSLIILDALSNQTMDKIFAFGNNLNILPDGKRIGFTLNGIMYIYLIDTTDLMDKACSILEKNGISGLSPDEWSKYMGDESYRQTCPCSEELYLMSPTSYSTKSDYSLLRKRLKQQQIYFGDWYLY
jgi:WD40 repeat protein